MGAWLLIACSQPAPWKAALVAEPAEALVACEELEGLAAHECAYGVLRQHDLVDEPHCRALDGVYRDECLFAVAEGLADEGRHAEAAAMCRETGARFERSCYQHGWFRAADEALAATIEPGGPEAAAVLARAVEAYGADLEDAEGTIWTAYWWAWWEGREAIDLTTCPDERCREASLIAAARYGWVAGCEGDASLRCGEDEACTAALAEGKAQACAGRPRPGTPVFRSGPPAPASAGSPPE